MTLADDKLRAVYAETVTWMARLDEAGSDPPEQPVRERGVLANR